MTKHHEHETAETTTDTENGAKWLSPRVEEVLTRKGKPAFIPLDWNPEHFKEVDEEVLKRDYVLGMGTAGMGYYSLETKEAYTIMDVRLEAKEKATQREEERLQCCHCLCFRNKPTHKELEEETKLEERIKGLKSKRDYLRSLLEADSPKADAIPQDILREYGGHERKEEYLTSKAYTPLAGGAYPRPAALAGGAPLLAAGAAGGVAAGGACGAGAGGGGGGGGC